MFLKFLKKFKSILSKESISEPVKPKKVSKTIKATKASKSKKSTKAVKATKPKTSKKPKKEKKVDAKLIIESFTSIPGIGAKSAKAFYDAGFRSKKDIISAKDDELLAVAGVGINLVKKLRDQK